MSGDKQKITGYFPSKNAGGNEPNNGNNPVPQPDAENEPNNEADSGRDEDESETEQDLSQPSERDDEPDDEPGDEPIRPEDSLPQCLFHHKWTFPQFAFLAGLPLPEGKYIELTHICRQPPHKKVHLYLKFFPNIRGSVKIHVQSSAKLRTFGKVSILKDARPHICLQGELSKYYLFKE